MTFWIKTRICGTEIKIQSTETQTRKKEISWQVKEDITTKKNGQK